MLAAIGKVLSHFDEDEDAQGLVEYMMILALIVFGATAGMKSLAAGVNSAFTQMSTIVGGYIT